MPNFMHGYKMPTFPSTWYHPVYGAAYIKDYGEFQKLDDNWREHPGVADMDRTETEARVVMNHNDQVNREAIMKDARRLNIKPEDAIVCNSVQSDVAAREGKPQPL